MAATGAGQGGGATDASRSAPLTEVTMIQSYSARCSAAARKPAPPSAGSAMSITGTSTGTNPAATSRAASSPA
jgi:hypothetical protein